MSRAGVIVRWLACCALATPTAAPAAEIALTPGDGVAELAPFARYALNDLSPLHDFAVAAALPEAAFAPVEGHALAVGFTDRDLWITFTLHNTSAERGVWLLNLGHKFASELIVYEQRPSGPRVLLRESSDVAFNERVLPHRYLLARLELGPDEHSRVLIGYRSSGTTTLPAIATPDGFAEWDRVDSMINAAFYAAMTFMLLLGLAQAVLLGVRVQLYYAAYVGTALLYVAQIDGTALQFVWPSRPGWNAFAALPLGVAFGVAAAASARVFLRTRGYALHLDRALRAAIGIGVGWLVAAAFIDSGALERTGLWLAIALSALCLVGATATWLRGRRSVRFYAVGAGAMFVAIMVAAAAHLASLPLSVGEGLEVLKGGIVFDALMFAAAMADSARETRAQRDAAVQRALAAVAEQELASDRLHAAHKARVEAQLLAKQQDQVLADTTRGVQAPIAALRTAIAGLSRERRVSAETAARFARGVDYLERLARSYAGIAAPSNGGSFRLDALIGEIESLFRDAALAKGLALRCRTCSLEACGDTTSTLRILCNLVENAIKYTRTGKVLVGCRRRGKDALGILVADTGPGMSSAELDVALEPYRRGAAGRRTEGAGLGLAITARLAADLGYGFTARAEPGRGSVFELVVPLASAAVRAGGSAN